MKRITIICLISILILGNILPGRVYAILSCKVGLRTSKSAVVKEEEFSVDVNISNLQTEKGIVALGAMLDYDKTALELKEVNGENKWSTQIGKNNTKIVAYSGKKVMEDETTMKLTFVVKKDTTAKSAWIKIDNFEISDGNKEISATGDTITISIQEKQVTPPKDESENQGSSSTTTKPNTSTTKPNKKPDTSNKKPTDTSNQPVTENPDVTKEESTKMNVTSSEEVSNTALGIQEEMQNLMQSSKEQTIEQKKNYKWVLIIALVIIAVIVIAISGYCRRKRK